LAEEYGFYFAGDEFNYEGLRIPGKARYAVETD